MWRLMILWILNIAAIINAKPEAMQCPPCIPASCSAIGDCSRGITWDVCRCCEVCAKIPGQECGGPWNAYGKCGYGLTCVKDARECPYLFNPRGSASSNICDDYLFNAIGRCMEEESALIKAFKRKPHRISPTSDLALNVNGLVDESLLTDNNSKVGKRLMLKGVLRGVEY